MQIADKLGWRASYKRGSEILQDLIKMSPESREKFDVTKYRGEKVAFVGIAAPPGGTNDLFIDGGFYVRVVNKEGKDLRPTAVWWEVMIQGEVMQVLPKNKIIVLEVDEKGWFVLETG